MLVQLQFHENAEVGRFFITVLLPYSPKHTHTHTEFGARFYLKFLLFLFPLKYLVKCLVGLGQEK